MAGDVARLKEAVGEYKENTSRLECQKQLLLKQVTRKATFALVSLPMHCIQKRERNSTYADSLQKVMKRGSCEVYVSPMDFTGKEQRPACAQHSFSIEAVVRQRVTVHSHLIHLLFFAALLARRKSLLASSPLASVVLHCTGDAASFSKLFSAAAHAKHAKREGRRVLRKVFSVYSGRLPTASCGTQETYTQHAKHGRTGPQSM